MNNGCMLILRFLSEFVVYSFSHFSVFFSDVNEDGSVSLHNVSFSALERVLDFCRFEWPGDYHSPPVRNPER